MQEETTSMAPNTWEYNVDWSYLKYRRIFHKVF